ncbi:MAG: class I SAM-dependent methyltransferase [Chloroflexi bacterium]|nr:class I SAM-dependent methyltransferase [Chloroflexota bacterium]
MAEMVGEWHEEFFRGLGLDLWRQMATREQTEAEVDFLQTTLSVVPPARLLDVPCGNGRHSIEMAARGYAMTGVDITDELIHEGQGKAAAAGLSVDWSLGDMRKLRFDSEFDGAFCLGNSFGYLDDRGNRAFLAGVSRGLRPGARFVLDTAMAAESILPGLPEREWLWVGDILVLIQNHYWAGESRLDSEYSFVRGGTTERRTASCCIYTVAEIKRMLRQVELQAIATWSSLDAEPLRLGDHRLLLVSEKL